VSERDLDEPEVEETLAPTGAHVVFISGMLSRFNEVVDVLAPRDVVPSPAWLEQARRNAEERSRFLDEFGALDSEGVATLARSRSANRRSVCSTARRCSATTRWTTSPAGVTPPSRAGRRARHLGRQLPTDSSPDGRGMSPESWPPWRTWTAVGRLDRSGARPDALHRRCRQRRLS
jgi:hypothetical protein